jgi:hypothetical protein
MLYQYPLESLARRRATTSQIDFAKEARRVLVDSDDAMFEAHDHGLAIFAANEDALQTPVRVLKDMYGDFVDVRRPKVRVVPGNPPQEPIMHVRISMRTDYSMGVLAELRTRGARIVEQCIRGRVVILRAEAPLASLLGLPSRLDAMTDGTAAQSIRLLRYAPVPAPTRPAA